ncbi:hypothetical protein XENOCAPTIV_000723 [Xenoophorus captivus]|uniref:Secreted protein n=1 Tax=Xenoophorus captivus TaxID=1517983 RepID=A0ABV0RMY6_9TELE
MHHCPGLLCLVINIYISLNERRLVINYETTAAFLQQSFYRRLGATAMSLLVLTHNKLAFSIEVQETVKTPGVTLATTLVNMHFVLLNGEIRPACIIGVHNCAVSGRNNLSVVIIFQLCTHSAKGQRWVTSGTLL